MWVHSTCISTEHDKLIFAASILISRQNIFDSNSWITTISIWNIQLYAVSWNSTSSYKRNVFIAPALNSRFSQSRVSLHESSARARWSERNKNCLVASSFISFLTVGFFAFSSRYYFSIEFIVILICFWMSHVPLLRFFSIPPMNNIVILLHHPR